MKNSSNKGLTNGVSSHEVVLLSAYLLGADTRPIDTEDIAVKANKLSPGRFSWRKYPDQINLELIRVSLSDLKKLSHGRLLDGSGRQGWTLTEPGLRWIKQHQERLLGADMSRSAKDKRFGSIDAVRRQRERDRLLGSKAWAAWKNNLKLTTADAASLLRIDTYVTERMLGMKANRLREMFSDEEEISEFLDVVLQTIREGDLL